MKRQLQEGNYRHERPEWTQSVFVYVSSKMDITNPFDHRVVTDFFQKFKIEFFNASDGEWYFTFNL